MRKILSIILFLGVLITQAQETRTGTLYSDTIRLGVPTEYYKLYVNNGFFVTDGPFSDSVLPNQAPTVAITSPSTGSNHILNEVVTATASASDPDGAIDSVRFYQTSGFVAVDADAPYEVTLPTSVAGGFEFWVIAFDDAGATATDTIAYTVEDTSAVTEIYDAVLTYATSNSLTEPATLYKDRQREILNDFDSAGIVANMDYVSLLSGSMDFARINMVNPSMGLATINNSGTAGIYDATKGLKDGVAPVVYMNTMYNPNTLGEAYKADTASIVFVVFSPLFGANEKAYGAVGGVSSYMSVWVGDSTMNGRLNNSSTVSSAKHAGVTGVYQIDRIHDTVYFSVNGVLMSQAYDPSARSLPNMTMDIVGFNNNGNHQTQSSAYIGAVIFGGNLHAHKEFIAAELKEFFNNQW